MSLAAVPKVPEGWSPSWWERHGMVGGPEKWLITISSIQEAESLFSVLTPGCARVVSSCYGEN